MPDPVLQASLPKEVLLLIFAHLPVRDVFRLRGLLREWRRDLAVANSGINQACDEASPPILAGFSRLDVMLGGSPGVEFLVTVCAQSSHHSYRLQLGDPALGENRWDDVDAGDGGLICFVSTWKPTEDKPLCIVVANLLTRARRRLPPLQHAYSTPPKMTHVEVDSETKGYRVVVVWEDVDGHPRVETYHSGTEQWTAAMPSDGIILGFARQWQYFDDCCSFRSSSSTRSVYDFAKGRLESPDWGRPCSRGTLTTYLNDCKFELEGPCITKYQMEANVGELVKQVSYSCSPFEALLEGFCGWRWTLRACEGLVMVFPFSWYSSIPGIVGPSGHDSHCGHFWLLDLATGEWSSRPNCFRGHQHHSFLMCRAFWNIVP